MKPKNLSLFLVIVALLSIPHSAIAADKDQLPLQPSSHWTMHYEDDSCVLMRSFGTKDQRVTIAMSRFDPSDYFRLTISGKPVRLRRTSLPLQLQFGTDGGRQELDYFIGNVGDKPALVGKTALRIAPPTDQEQKLIEAAKLSQERPAIKPISSERYAATKSLVITLPQRFSMILNTGPLSKPFSAMDKCIDNLLTKWGIDVDKHKNLSRPVRMTSKSPNIAYPTEMLRIGQPALVEFRLSISAEGRVTDCHIQETTRAKEFDNAICRNFKRKAQFDPALDAAGNPIASYWQNSVRFQIKR